jgi:hypothetical protein
MCANVQLTHIPDLFRSEAVGASFALENGRIKLALARVGDHSGVYT